MMILFLYRKTVFYKVKMENEKKKNIANKLLAIERKQNALLLLSKQSPTLIELQIIVLHCMFENICQPTSTFFSSDRF